MMSEKQPQSNPEESEVFTQESKEGIRPRQLFQSLENIAKNRVDGLKEMDDLMQKHDVVYVSNVGKQEYRELGPFSEELSNEQQEIFKKTYFNYEMENLTDEVKEEMRQRMVYLEQCIDAKHIVCTETEKHLESTYRGFTESGALERNNIAAQHLFGLLMGQEKPVPPGLHYFESELGITFTLEDKKILSDLFLSEEVKFETAQDKTKEVDGTIGGFFTVKGFNHNESLGVKRRYDVGVVFQLSLGNLEGKEIINHATHLHEKQHLIDLMITQGLSEKRRKHLESRKSSNIEDEIGQLLSQEDRLSLRTEIFAFGSTNFMRYEGVNPYTALTENILYKPSELYDGLDESIEDNSKNEANPFQEVYDKLVDKLKKDKGLDKSEEEKLRDKYKMFLSDTMHAVSGLTLMYDAEFKNDEYSRQMAIALLDMFPMEDWPKIQQAMPRYTQYESYKKRSDEWEEKVFRFLSGDGDVNDEGNRRLEM